MEKTAPQAFLRRRYCFLCLDADSPDLEGRILDYLRLVHERDEEFGFKLFLFAPRRQGYCRFFDREQRAQIEQEIGGRLIAHRYPHVLLGLPLALFMLFIHLFPFCFSRRLILHARLSRGGGIVAAVFKLLCLGLPRLIIDAQGNITSQSTEVSHPLPAEAGALGEPIRPLRLWPHWFALKNANYLISRSALTDQTLLRRFPFAAAIPHVIVPSYADENIFYYDPTLRRLMRAELELARDEQVLLYAGGIQPYQGFDETIRIFAACLKENPRLRLMVAIPDEQYELAQSILADALPEDNYFLVSVPHERMNALLNVADMACLLRPPSPLGRAAAPVKFPEYILSGLPVVMTGGIGEYSELARRNDLGIVVDSLEEVEKTSWKILAWLGTHRCDGHRFKISQFGQKNLSKTRQIDQLMECYRRL